MRHRSAAIGALLIVSAGPVLSQDPDWLDYAAVDAGEIVLQTYNVSRGTVHIDLAIAIDADWEAIWEILTACEISPEFVPNVVDCRRIATDEACDCELFEQTVKPAFFLRRFDHVFRLEYHPPERIDVSHVSGPIDTMEGGWRIMDRPGKKTILMHSMTLNPSFPVPRFFVKNTLERDLPKVLREVRERAERAAAD